MSAGKWTAACACTLLSMAAQPAGAASPARGVDFDQAFDIHSQPKQGHFVASYVAQGQAHRLEVWRDGDVHLKRRTDDRVEIVVARPADDTEWNMTVLDLERRIRTEVARTSLIRIGHFADWFGLAHGVAHPVGAYALAPIAAPARVPVPVAACRWYRLTQGERSSKICWSKAHGLALALTDGEDRVQWQVTSVDAKPLPADTFVIDDRGFVRNDANEDIKAD